MRRVTKKLLIFILGVLFTFIYCEFLIYYVVAIQCSWPTVEQPHNDNQLLKAFILADTHLLGPRKGHWFDKWRREWQMHQAFQAIMIVHKPDVVFVLGDLFDEGEWSDDVQFQDYVDRFHKLFPIPNDTLMYVLAGNHDVGFHNQYLAKYWNRPIYNSSMRWGLDKRFTKLLNSTVVQFTTLKDNHFVLINSMAMEGDSCNLCTKARNDIIKVGGILKCSENQDFCSEGIKKIKYSRPILMQHFPLYRKSDETCTDPDAPPLSIRKKRFRIKIDVLSKNATEYLVSRIKPRVVFGGHTHHSCLQHHVYRTSESPTDPIDFYEYSVPSFSWRNRPNPKYMLVTITPSTYSVNKCGLPKETTIVVTAVIMLATVLWLSTRQKRLGR